MTANWQGVKPATSRLRVQHCNHGIMHDDRKQNENPFCRNSRCENKRTSRRCSANLPSCHWQSGKLVLVLLVVLATPLSGSNDTERSSSKPINVETCFSTKHLLRMQVHRRLTALVRTTFTLRVGGRVSCVLCSTSAFCVYSTIISLLLRVR